ncbi:MAG: hypothetical protein QXX12_00745 [Nanopusillaceae archaeon]
MSLEELTAPNIAELLKYAFRYNVVIRTMYDILILLRKVIDLGHYDTAENILQLIISNMSSPPYYIIPIPTNTIVLKMFFIGDKFLSQEKIIDYPEGTKTSIVVVFLSNPSRDKVDIMGWKLIYIPSLKRFASQILTLWEIEAICEKIVKKLGEISGDEARKIGELIDEYESTRKRIKKTYEKELLDEIIKASQKFE